LRKVRDGPGCCGAGIGGEAHHFLPSSRMARTQDVVASFARVATL
jgi:hypothetical protein